MGDVFDLVFLVRKFFWIEVVLLFGFYGCCFYYDWFYFVGGLILIVVVLIVLSNCFLINGELVFGVDCR